MSPKKILIAAACVLVVPAALAHHGWSTYDEGNEITVTGKIVESNYRNPHATIRVEGEDKKVWFAWLGPLGRMESRGLDKSMVEVGDTVTVVGYPSNVEESEMRAERIIIDGTPTELR